MKNIVGLVVSFVFIGIVIVAGKFFEKAGKEASRKFIHIMLCNWWIIAMCFFENAIWASIGPICFVVINYLSYQKNWISVMERDSKEEGLGTVYYALTLLILVIFTFGILKKPEIGLCAAFIMGYGDGLAAVIGRAVKSYTYHVGKSHKTLAGSLTMFLVSLIILSIFLYTKQVILWPVKAVGIAILVTIAEAVSLKGTDNLTVPLSAAILLSFMV